MWQWASAYKHLITWMNFFGTPAYWRAFQIASSRKLSKAFSKSTKIEYRGNRHLTDCSTILRRVLIRSIHGLWGRKPAYSGLRRNSLHSFFTVRKKKHNIVVKIFQAFNLSLFIFFPIGLMRDTEKTLWMIVVLTVILRNGISLSLIVLFKSGCMWLVWWSRDSAASVTVTRSP